MRTSNCSEKCGCWNQCAYSAGCTDGLRLLCSSEKWSRLTKCDTVIQPFTRTMTGAKSPMVPQCSTDKESKRIADDRKSSGMDIWIMKAICSHWFLKNWSKVRLPTTFQQTMSFKARSMDLKSAQLFTISQAWKNWRMPLEVFSTNAQSTIWTYEAQRRIISELPVRSVGLMPTDWHCSHYLPKAQREWCGMGFLHSVAMQKDNILL